MKDDEGIQVTFTLPAQLAADLREECEHFEVDVNDVVADALRFWLEEHQVPIQLGIEDIDEWHWR